MPHNTAEKTTTTSSSSDDDVSSTTRMTAFGGAATSSPYSQLKIESISSFRRAEAMLRYVDTF